MIIHADSYQYIDTMEDGSIDTVITDPPYGLKFMGKKWDYDIPRRDFWEKVYRVCKPGAILLVFGGSRTFHRLAVEIEDAGFEIRDTLSWIYGSGFPKSHDISKAIDKHLGVEPTIVEVTETKVGVFKHSGGGTPQDHTSYIHKITEPTSELAREWNGWGTALKPAWEPIIVAMKPVDGTYASNALQYGVAGFHLDAARIPTDEKRDVLGGGRKGGDGVYGYSKPYDSFSHPAGRFPANALFDEEAAEMLGLPARFFYVAKASRAERDRGLEHMPDSATPFGQDKGDGLGRGISNTRTDIPIKNNHPTVKPIALLEYLCKLTETPTGGVILDPFMGSGSLAIAARNTGRDYIGIEIDEGYVAIAKERLNGAA